MASYMQLVTPVAVNLKWKLIKGFCLINYACYKQFLFNYSVLQHIRQPSIRIPIWMGPSNICIRM